MIELEFGFVEHWSLREKDDNQAQLEIGNAEFEAVSS